MHRDSAGNQREHDRPPKKAALRLVTEREDPVGALRRDMDNGSYRRDAAEVAECVIDAHLSKGNS